MYHVWLIWYKWRWHNIDYPGALLQISSPDNQCAGAVDICQRDQHKKMSRRNELNPCHCSSILAFCNNLYICIRVFTGNVLWVPDLGGIWFTRRFRGVGFSRQFRGLVFTSKLRGYRGKKIGIFWGHCRAITPQKNVKNTPNFMRLAHDDIWIWRHSTDITAVCIPRISSINYSPPGMHASHVWVLRNIT